MAYEIPLEVIQSKLGEQINVYVLFWSKSSALHYLKKMLKDGNSFCFKITQFAYHRDSVPSKI